MSRRKLLAILLACTIALIGAVTSPIKAMADPTWPIDITSLHYGYTIPHANGATTLINGCDLKTWLGESEINDISGTGLVCNSAPGAMATDPDNGTVYTVKYDTSQPWSSAFTQVLALTDDGLDWSVNLPCHSRSASSLVVGADGDVYVVYDGIYCNGKSGWWVTGIDTATHTIKFDTPLGYTFYEVAGSLKTYGEGFVIRQSYDKFHFYSYNGQENQALKYEPSGMSTTSFYLGSWTVNPEGTIFLQVSDHVTSGSCVSQDLFTKVVARKTDLSTQTWSTQDDCLENTTMDELHVTPEGGVATVVDVENGASSQNPKLQILRASGTHSYIDYLVGGTRGRVGRDLKVDASGDLMLARSYVHADGYSNTDTDTEFVLLNPAGSTKAIFSTSKWNTPAEDYRPYGGSYELSNGAIYARMGINPYKLYRIPFAEVQVEYPMSELFDVSWTETELNYVALGDSFSSGEGVEPFYEATERENINECHRSKKAYAELLDKDPEFSLNLTKFVACSGAMTSNIINTAQWDEGSAQSAALAGADVVTVSIGGNDVSFAPTITRCLIEASGMGNVPGDCDDALDASEAQLNDLDVVLGNAFDKIKDEIGSQTEVYVVGYPHILPQQGTTFIPACSGIVFSGYGLSRIWNLTDSLNDVVFDEVLSAGNQFHYVDPTVEFSGHEICTSDPYVNDLTIPLAYSLHPNEKGQKAYAEALSLAMS